MFDPHATPDREANEECSVCHLTQPCKCTVDWNQPDHVLDCKYPGAVAWGKNYLAPGRDVREATNGSAPGYKDAAN